MARFTLKKLAKRSDVLVEKQNSLPPGFEVRHYQSLNPDVAAAHPDEKSATNHYLCYGIAELRQIMPEGVGIQDKQHRMLTLESDRSNWLPWLRKQGDVNNVLTIHPRAAWLNTPFNLASYLGARPDVAVMLDDPLQGAFHFLEFGIEEGNYGYARQIEPRYLRKAYPALFADARESELSNIDAVIRRLRAAGESAIDIALTEAEFWELQGFPGLVLCKIFDHEYYHANATRQGQAPDKVTRLACLIHFCIEGSSAGLLVSPDHVFDPSFYLDHSIQMMNEATLGTLGHRPRDERLKIHLEDLARDLGISSEELYGFSELAGVRATCKADVRLRLYQHWLRVGLRNGTAPNVRYWAKSHFGITLPHSLADRMRRLSDAAFEEYGSALDRLTRLLREPMGYLEHMPELSLDEAAALASLGDRMAIEGQVHQAEWLYRTVLTEYPHYEKAISHLADLMSRVGRAGAEYQLRLQLRALPRKKDGGRVWNLLALAELALNQDRLRIALTYIEAAAEDVRGDKVQHDKYKTLVTRFFHHLWGQIGIFARDYGVQAAQDFLYKCLKIATPDQGPAAKPRGQIRRIALVANMDLYQCKFYRVDQKAEQLRAAGFDVSLFNQWKDIKAFLSRLNSFDAAIFYRVPAFPEIMEAIAACSTHGVPSFYEIDDLVFDRALFPPPYDNYAGQITPDHHRDMACGVPLYDHSMRMCDYAIASTRVLAERMAACVRSGKAFEHHNALSKLHLNAIAEHNSMPARREFNRPLVLFYGSGTLAHKEDFHNILEPALAEILARYRGMVEVQLVGRYNAFQHLDRDSDAIRIKVPEWDFEQYCTMVSGADINLSVLARTAVTDAKSEIKWMEAAMFGIPSVVSYTATHADIIEDGKTGFLAKTTRDFVDHISSLIENHDLRSQIGQNARHAVMTRYDLATMGQNLRDIFAQIAAPKREKPLLLIVNVFYPPQAIGGATRVVHDNVTDLQAKYAGAYDICVICTQEGAEPYSISAYIHAGVPVWAIGTPDQGGTEMNARDSRMGELFDGLLGKLRPDLVHFHCIQRLTSSIVAVTREREIPYVITVHDGWWISPRQFLLDPETDECELYNYSELSDPATPSRARSLWPALSGAQAILAVSDSFAQIHRECHVPKVMTVENGVSRFPQVTRQPNAKGRVRLAHLGGTERHKGLPLLRNALVARHFKNLELLVIDHALPPGHMEHDVWGNTPIIRRGKVPQSEVGTLYAQIDILVAPSLWPESYGLVTREALASDAWVIASNRGAVGSDVQDTLNGYLVDVSDYTGLLRVLGAIDARPERYSTAPEVMPELREAVEQVKELAQLYSRILSEDKDH